MTFCNYIFGGRLLALRASLTFCLRSQCNKILLSCIAVSSEINAVLFFVNSEFCTVLRAIVFLSVDDVVLPSFIFHI